MVMRSRTAARSAARLRLVVLAVVAVLTAGLLGSIQLPASAASRSGAPVAAGDAGNRVSLPPARHPVVKSVPPKDVRARAVHLPAAGTRTVPVRPGGAAVPASPFTVTPAGGASPPASVRVDTLGATAVQGLGALLGFRVERADGAAGPGEVRVGIDYSGIADAYGGGYAGRLQVLAYPACVLTTPKVPACQAATVVPSHNDLGAERLRVDLPAMPAGQPITAASAATSASGVRPPAEAPGRVAAKRVPAKAPVTVRVRTAAPRSSGTHARPRYHAQVPPMSAVAKLFVGRNLPVATSPALTAPAAAPATGATVFAVAAAPAAPDGTYAATSLKANGTWTVGLQAGSFDYDYPVAVPPAQAGAAPDVKLTYSSQAVDGMTSRENRQPVVGTGWDLPIPFIERKFLPCKGSNAGSQCWGGENATLSLNGHSSTLVQLAADGDVTPFGMLEDAGYRVERIYAYSGNANGDGVGLYWRVTTPDGTQYFFGRENPAWQNRANNSTLTEPVLSPNDGDPCHDGGSNVCTMAYRWNLAYVVDIHGNITSYKYGKDRYTYQPQPGVYWDYDGGSRLFDIDYGQRLDNVKTTQPAQRVDFAYRWRCESWVDLSNCEPGDLPSASHPDWYPDIPFDLVCGHLAEGDLCPNNVPRTLSYYSLRRLDQIQTSYLKPDGTRQAVNTTWFGHGFMFGTDSYTSASMIIDRLWTLGADTSSALPGTTFGYTMKPNQWDGGTSFGLKPRMADIETELGGRTHVTYGQPDPCSAAQNALHRSQNASDCWQVTNDDGSAQYFQKWLVSKVDVTDRDGAPTQTTNYAYSANSNPGGVAPAGEGAGWHSDEDLVSPLSQQGWTQYRGYQKVKVTRTRAAGTPATDVYKYFRGLDGDYVTSSDRSQRRSDAVTTALSDTNPAPDSTWGRSVTDTNQLKGQLLEHRSLGADGLERGADQHDYTIQLLYPGPKDKAGNYLLPVARALDSTATNLYTSGGTLRARQHAVSNGYDDYGRMVWEQDGGDAASGIGPSCTWTTWATNTAAWLLDSDQRVVRAGAACGPAEPTQNLIARTDTLYDNWSTPGFITAGDPTDIAIWTGPAGPPSAVSRTKTRYDAAGRVTGVLSPDQATASSPVWKTTAYDDSTGPVTRTTVTDETGAVTTTVVDPGHGQPLTVTDPNGRATKLTYDVFGRLTAVRRPGDSYDTTTYGYSLPDGRDAPARVSTTTYSAPGQGVTSYSYLDSLGRTFQSETPSPASGQRIVTGTRYDEHGNTAAIVSGIVVGGTPGTAISNWYDPTWDATLPSTTRTTYDEFDRAVSQSLYGAGNSTPVWTTTTSYDGFSTTTTPASNATASEPDLSPTTVTNDVFDRPVSRTQGGQTQTNTYDAAGNLVQLKSPLGKVSTYTYDWAGHRLTTSDPDAGLATADYYPSGALRHTRDAKGQDVFTAIDVLGRVTGTYAGTDATGTKLTQTVYDGVPLGGTTALKGTVTSKTSWTSGNAYTEAYGYDARYRVTRTDQTIPNVSGSQIGKLAGAYSTAATFDDANRQATITYPAAGGLNSETVTTTYSGAYATKLSSPLASYVTDTGYTNIGQLASRTLGAAGSPGSASRTYGYDLPTGRLLTEAATARTASSTVTAENDSYTYTPGGDVSKITDAVANQRQCYSYDALDRLVAASTSASGSQTGTACTADSSGPSPYKQSYGYDADGDLTSQVTAGVTTTYGYGTDSTRGLTGGPHAPTTATTNGTTTTYSYDADGQLVRRVAGGATTTYTWNAQQRLASFAVGSQTSTFVDGPTGSRWIRQSPTETVAYLAGQELHVAAGSSTVTAIRYYTHDGHTVGERRTGTGSGLYWLLGDRQGSDVIAVNGADGSVLRDRYLPFGGNRSTGFQLPTDRGWLGQIHDTDTGLDYLNARYYDPALAHFISTDPLNVTATPQDANPYAYASDNPITSSDPSGLCNPDVCQSDGEIGQAYKVVKGKLTYNSAQAVRVAVRKAKARLAAAKAPRRTSPAKKPGFIDGVGHALTALFPFGAGAETVANAACGSECHLRDPGGVPPASTWTTSDGTPAFPSVGYMVSNAKDNRPYAAGLFVGAVVPALVESSDSIAAGATRLAGRAATSGARSATAAGARTFTSPDPLVAAAANAIEAAAPGRVAATNVMVRMNNGLSREIDIDLGDIVVQVKSGNARGIAGQMQKTAASTGKLVVGFAPDMPGQAWETAARDGVAIARNHDELVAIVKEWG